MRNQKGGLKLGTIIITIILIVFLVIAFNKFKENYFNGFEKATRNKAQTNFTRDSQIKYSESSSYKIENVEYNDSVIYKEIEVEQNTVYKVSCMVKTENVICKDENEEGGVSIGLLDTTEYSEAIVGTNEWKRMEFMFNSKNRDKVNISFRIGGNTNTCVGTVWFSDFKLEKGTNENNYDWNIGCFIINELDVNIDGKQYKLNTNTEDIENIKRNMKRFKEDCYEFSKKKMQVNYEITEIDIPVKTITYSEEHGYYLSYKDIKNIIYDKVKQEEYDHVFIVCRMENDEGNISIPILNNWIGLGGMDIYGIGYSLIRITKNSNQYTYKYGISNQNPEEVYIHEFCHTLERNLIEYGYEIPALHDYEKYGYKDGDASGLKKWYKDYMSKNILEETTGQYIGLDEFCYTIKPAKNSNFKYSIEIEFNTEPQNLFEDFLTIFNVLENAI